MKGWIPLVLLAAASTAGAQEGGLELSGSGWVNSKSLDLARLRGKVVALYFYEEG